MTHAAACAAPPDVRPGLANQTFFNAGTSPERTNGRHAAICAFPLSGDAVNTEIPRGMDGDFSVAMR